MRIAPIDIAHKNFAKKIMGFDSDEVIEFLREIADQMEELIRERNSLKETLRDKELQILEYRDRDETLKTTITTATKMAEQIRVDAEREAKLIMNDANQKAELIVRDARDSLKRIYQEIGEMKRARIQFEANLRSLAQAHLAMLDQGHQMMPDFSSAGMNWGPSALHHMAPTQSAPQQQQMSSPVAPAPVQQTPPAPTSIHSSAKSQSTLNQFNQSAVVNTGAPQVQNPTAPLHQTSKSSFGTSSTGSSKGPLSLNKNEPSKLT